MTSCNKKRNRKGFLYLFEDDLNASLVTNTVYPDSTSTPTSGTDLVKVTYNLDGSLDTMTDQRGTVHTYSYNNRRQLELDAITTLGGTGHNVDDYVQSIKRTYDFLGRLQEIRSYASNNGSGGPRSRAFSSYNSYGQVSELRQHHNQNNYSRSIQYAFDESETGYVFTNGLRQKNTTYPDGRIVHSTYGSIDSVADRLSRVDKIEADSSGSPGTDLMQYQYNGTGRVAKVDYAVPDVRREMFSSGNNYDAWDRFGRTVVQQWDKYNTGAGVRDQVNYTYDYAGNRLSRNVNASSNDTRDQKYDYDGLHRLKNAQGGTLSSGSITNRQLEQDWTLDQLGNWSTFKERDTDTGSTWDLDQDRTHNDANEMLTLDVWQNPVHDAAGNMTTLPQPLTPSSSFLLKYDAWNRLVEVKDDTTVVQTNQFDGLNRRILRTEGGETRHFYYSQQWQVLEERVGLSALTAQADKQYVYHPHYVDAIAVRYWDKDNASGNGLEEEHYYLQDANFNVTAVADDTGTVVERYAYTPYGEVTVLDADFSDDANNISDISNEYLYTGRRLDPETGLQLNRNRFYHALLGRWINRDPIGYDAGWYNLSNYVENKPIIRLDSHGLSFCAVSGPFGFSIFSINLPDPYTPSPGGCYRFGIRMSQCSVVAQAKIPLVTNGCNSMFHDLGHIKSIHCSSISDCPPGKQCKAKYRTTSQSIVTRKIIIPSRTCIIIGVIQCQQDIIIHVGTCKKSCPKPKEPEDDGGLKNPFL